MCPPPSSLSFMGCFCNLHHFYIPLDGLTSISCKFIKTELVKLMRLNPLVSSTALGLSFVPSHSVAPSSPYPSLDPSSKPSNLPYFDPIDFFSSDSWSPWPFWSSCHPSGSGSNSSGFGFAFRQFCLVQFNRFVCSPSSRSAGYSIEYLISQNDQMPPNQVRCLCNLNH